MKKTLAILLLLAVCLTGVFANGEKEAAGPQNIVIWSSWTGKGGAALQEMVEQFNASQQNYVLELSYQGSYAEILAKYQAADASSRPDGIMVSTEYVSYFIDQGKDYYYPVQKFADEDKYDLTDLFDNLQVSYSKDGQLLCVPTGNTVVGFFYNTAVLKAAGINPETDLNSMEELEQACYKLAANGVKYPFALVANSIYYTFFVTAQGLQYVDNNNGADAVPTRCLINEEPLRSETIKYFSIIKRLNEAGLIAPIDFSASDNRQSLVNGDIAMLCSTCSSANAIGTLSDWQVEIGFHPAITISAGTTNYGQCTGGGCMFIANNGSESKARGVWEFCKIMMSPENTAKFAINTGYLPTTKSGYNSPEYQEFVKTKFPTAINAKIAQENTADTCFNAWLPEFGDVHQIMIDNIKLCLNDPSYTAEQLTEKLAKEFDEAIRLYNLTR
ncbi:MAG: extracellular solute-binding protein [Spirochaetales bacterium]|nr:extracellular solute-binding protein [Spirochaetales bacterium]